MYKCKSRALFTNRSLKILNCRERALNVHTGKHPGSIHISHECTQVIACYDYFPLFRKKCICLEDEEYKELLKEKSKSWGSLYKI